MFKSQSPFAKITSIALISLSSCAVGFVSPSVAASVNELQSPAVGKPAPDFTLTDTHGKTHALSESKGKYVVLEWFNEGCPFVKKHYDSNNMQTLQKEYTGKGVVWFTINSSAAGKQGNHTASEYNKILADKKAASTALLMDHDGQVGKLYGAKTTPDMYIVDKKGILIYSGAIDDTRSTDAADIPKSKNYVKEALDAALADKAVTVATTKPYGCSVKYQD